MTEPLNVALFTSGVVILVCAFIVFMRAWRSAHIKGLSKREWVNIEHGLVVAGALLVAALGNVVTGIGFGVSGTAGEDIVSLGAIVARGGLIIAVVYLLVRIPGLPREGP